ncbi:hypothetical protein [uncultured Hymenobacter sp.]|uniref:hypothetical protein n=1 Tax=uncultured Hymenobacter sp. TaxID=170016 RepID=UPI0035CC64C0
MPQFNVRVGHYSLRIARQAGSTLEPHLNAIRGVSKTSRPPTGERWGALVLAAVVGNCWGLAVWLDMLLHPLAFLGELLDELLPGPREARPPTTKASLETAVCDSITNMS